MLVRTLQMRFLVMLWGVCLMLGACAAPFSSASPPTSGVASSIPQLRIHNASDLDLEQLVVRFPNQAVTFQSVPAGATTDYQDVPGGVYSYAAYEATLDGQKIRQGVGDWLGEQPFEGNAFTYVITIDPQQPEFAMIQSEVRRD